MSGGRIRALLVEDNPGDVRLIRELLADAAEGGIELEWVDRLAPALERLRQAEDVDVILLDLGLPDSQGLETLTRLGTHAERVPIVVLTGLADDVAALEAMGRGAQDYVSKGALTGPMLMRVIRYAIERKRSEEQLRRRLDKLEAIYRVADAASRADAVDVIYREALEAMARGVGADRASVRTLAPDGVMRYQAWLGLSDAYRAAVEQHVPWLPHGMDPRPVVVPNVEAEPRLAPLRPAFAAEGIRAMAFVPLVRQERLIGRFTVYYPAPRDLGDEELGLLQTIAGHVAFAIERTQAEEKVRLSEERLRTLTETATDAIITMGPEGRILTFNRAAERMFGHPSEAMIGRSIDPLIPEEQAERHRAGLSHYLETGESAILGRTVELEGRRRSGEIFPIELSLSVARAGGDITFGATVRDIGERKRAEEALREQEERYRTLFEQSPDGIVAIDPETTRPVDFNSAAHRQLGYSREEFARLSIRDYEILETETDTRARIERLLREGGAKFETRHRTKTGEIRDVLVTVRAITMGGRRVFHAVFQDVTEPKRAAEALRQTEKLAAMGELLAGVAHELNNPLAVVMGRATMLRDKVAGSALADGAEKLRQAAERCARIVKNFLALARQHPPERDQVELNRIVIEAVELLAYPLRVDSVDVSLSLASDLPILWADPHQLHQVLVNLITNAHHAMREAPLPRRLAISTRLDPDPRRVQLEVADNGPGIPHAIAARIFEPFFTTKPVGQGTGLGLPLCKGIIESHGGTIRARNRSEGGATFVVELPLGTPAGPARAAGSASPITGRLILVVDDEPDVAAVLAEVLAADGHQVETAASGLIALDKLRVRAYDVILSDLKMPGLDGPGLYWDIARQHPDLRSRVAFVTGDTMNPETREFLEETGAPILDKPFTVEDVRRVVRQVVREPER